MEAALVALRAKAEQALVKKRQKLSGGSAQRTAAGRGRGRGRGRGGGGGAASAVASGSEGLGSQGRGRGWGRGRVSASGENSDSGQVQSQPQQDEHARPAKRMKQVAGQQSLNGYFAASPSASQQQGVAPQVHVNQEGLRSMQQQGLSQQTWLEAMQGEQHQHQPGGSDGTQPSGQLPPQQQQQQLSQARGAAESGALCDSERGAEAGPGANDAEAESEEQGQALSSMMLQQLRVEELVKLHELLRKKWVCFLGEEGGTGRPVDRLSSMCTDWCRWEL